MAPDDTRHRAPPPADESSKITADLIHGAPVVEAMMPPRSDARADQRERVRTMPTSLGALGTPLAMTQQMTDLLKEEIAFATDGFQQLLQARTPVEFVMTQSRLVSGFYQRLFQRSLGMTGMTGMTGRPLA